MAAGLLFLAPMKRASIASLLALAAVLAAAPASSQLFTAGALRTTCAVDRSNQVGPACVSYIQGYMDGRNQSLPRPTICIPPGTPTSAVVGGFTEHLVKNPLEANLEAGLVLGNYLLSTFPCR